MKGKDDDGNWIVQSWSGHERNHLFMNVAGKDFKDISMLSGVNSIADGRSFAYWDFDRDGWQDILLANANRPALEIFQNQLAKKFPNRKSIGFRLVGGNRAAQPSKEWSSRDAYGAKITVHCGGKKIVRELKCGEGFAAQNSKTTMIGLGEEGDIQSVQIAWPSGKSQQLSGLMPGQIVTVYENPDEAKLHIPAKLQDRQQTVWSTEPLQPVVPIQPIPEPFSKISFQINQKEADLPKPLFYAYTAMTTSCGVCKQSMPQVAELKAAFGDRVSFLGLPIDANDDQKKLEKYVELHAPPYRMVVELDAEGKKSAAKIVSHTLGAEMTPAFLVTNQKGKLVAATSGIPPVSWLAEKIAEQEGQAASTQLPVSSGD